DLAGTRDAPLDEEDSFVKLSPDLATARIVSPRNHALREQGDLDLGSGGPLLIPGTNKLIGGGKNGAFVLVETDTMSLAFPPRDLARVPGASPTEEPRSFQAFTNRWHPYAPAAPVCTAYFSAFATPPDCGAPEWIFDVDQNLAPNIHGGPVVWRAPDGVPRLY